MYKDKRLQKGAKQRSYEEKYNHIGGTITTRSHDDLLALLNHVAPYMIGAPP